MHYERGFGRKWAEKPGKGRDASSSSGSIIWDVKGAHAANESWFRLEAVFKWRLLAVTKWQRERGTTKKRRRSCWRSVTSKSHPKKHPGAEKIRGVWDYSGWYFGPFVGAFLLRATPLPSFMIENGGESTGRNPLAKTHTTRYLKTEPTEWCATVGGYGVLSFG